LHHFVLVDGSLRFTAFFICFSFHNGRSFFFFGITSNGGSAPVGPVLAEGWYAS
jgi:hypothetical protein